MRNFIILIFVLFIFKINAQSYYNADLIYESEKPANTFRLGKTNLFSQIYVESGVKLSTNADTIGNLHLGLIGFQHQLAKKITLFHSYNYLSQDNYWGSVNQGSYYTNFEYKMNSKIKFGLVGCYLNSNVRIAENSLTNVATKLINNQNYFGLINATFNYKKLYFKPMFAFSRLNNLSEKQNQLQTGGEILFDVKSNDALVFGLGIFHFVNGTSVSTLFKPSISYLISDEVHLSFDYFYTNATNYSDQNGFIIYNSIDNSIDRTTLNLRYEFANNLYLFGIYQFERKIYYESFTNYNFNSIFLGIKYNL